MTPLLRTTGCLTYGFFVLILDGVLYNLCHESSSKILFSKINICYKITLNKETVGIMFEIIRLKGIEFRNVVYEQAHSQNELFCT